MFSPNNAGFPVERSGLLSEHQHPISYCTLSYYLMRRMSIFLQKMRLNIYSVVLIKVISHLLHAYVVLKCCRWFCNLSSSVSMSNIDGRCMVSV
jgi:hypothetical protein